MSIKLNHLVRGSLLAILLPLSAHAVPVITNPFLFTENRNATSVTPAGHTLVLGATSITPSGPGTTVSATHVPPPIGPDYGLGFVPAPLFPDQYAIRTPYTGQSGQWDIIATDADGSTTVRTHTLDDIRILPLIAGFTVSGPALTPHLTWDPVDTVMFPSFCGGPNPPCAVGFDFFNYQVEVRIITGTPGNPAPLAFSSSAIPTFAPTVFDIAPGILSVRNEYLLGIRLVHNELEQIIGTFPGGPFTFVSPLENRSTTYIEHSVPEPGTLLLLSFGLAGALAIRVSQRRSRKARVSR